jgi:hypothetical protein
LDKNSEKNLEDNKDTMISTPEDYLPLLNGGEG